jgi:trehalose 6-phosphate synthase/phosphatase
LCHVAFERPGFDDLWYKGYKKVNQLFANAIAEEIKGKTFIWLQDYQLALVPSFLPKHKNSIVAMFWHIPWPTWEVFRILPQKKEILESLLACDFLAFHRGYQVRNFLETVRRELEVRIDDETHKVYFNNHVTTVMNLPLGIDTDVIKSLVVPDIEETFIGQIVQNILGTVVKPDQKPSVSVAPSAYDEFFTNHKVILGVDRLDYTKGLRMRLNALDQFLEKNPHYIGKVVYLGILAPSRETIPAYKALKKTIKELSDEINKKYATGDWQPIHMINRVFSREEIINFYKKAQLCLVTPLDDGMNLVSKEFVVASSTSTNPGMLVLSQFAGSAIDLTQALIVNPYNTDEVAKAIKTGLEMGKEEKKKRITAMVETLEEKNVYQWTQDFIRNALATTR